MLTFQKQHDGAPSSKGKILWKDVLSVFELPSTCRPPECGGGLAVRRRLPAASIADWSCQRIKPALAAAAHLGSLCTAKGCRAAAQPRCRSGSWSRGFDAGNCAVAHRCPRDCFAAKGRSLHCQANTVVASQTKLRSTIKASDAVAGILDDSHTDVSNRTALKLRCRCSW